MRRQIRQTLFLLVLMSSVGVSVQAESPHLMHHVLDLKLLPAENRLTATDCITIEARDKSTLSLTLAQHASIQSVRIDGREWTYDFNKGSVAIPLGEYAKQSRISVVIAYEAIFDDPTPRRPASTEDPSYGVAGTISPKGVSNTIGFWRL